jgi:hypothetical protein
MSLFKTIQELIYSFPLNEGLLTGLTLELTLEQFKDFVKKVNEEYKDFQPELIDWSTYDITKPITYLIMGGKKLTINIV